MSINLNLASQPFRNRTLPWVITIVIASVSLCALFIISSESRRVNREANLVERKLVGLRTETERQRAEHAAEVRNALSPEQLRALGDAHTLVNRKRFSWSRLFIDLESAVPTSVRVTRISVRDPVQQSGQETSAGLEMTVIGRAPNDVTHMISEMDRGGIFVATPLAQNTRNEKGEMVTELTLRVRYRPRPVSTSSAGESVNVASSALTTQGEKAR